MPFSLYIATAHWRQPKIITNHCQLLSKKKFDPGVLQTAIKQTFSNRGTKLRRDHPLFESAFEKDPDRNQLWEGFIKRSKLAEFVPFEEVMRVIRTILMPKE